MLPILTLTAQRLATASVVANPVSGATGRRAAVDDVVVSCAVVVVRRVLAFGAAWDFEHCAVEPMQTAASNRPSARRAVAFDLGGDLGGWAVDVVAMDFLSDSADPRKGSIGAENTFRHLLSGGWSNRDEGRPGALQASAVAALVAATATIPPRMSPAMPLPIRFIT